MKLIINLLFLCFTLSCLAQDEGLKKIGEEVFRKYESPHPYNNSENVNSNLVWTQEITYSGASYIAVHFSKFELAPNDYLIIKSPDGSRLWKYSNAENIEDAGFWSIPIYGEKAIIEIYNNNAKPEYGYEIDKIARGFQPSMIRDDQEAICGADNSLEAKCYEASEPVVYNKSRAVARLLINGTSACTGWLIGSEGHIMTNNHCVENSTTAANVTVEFMAEGANCNTDCTSWFDCPGNIEATSTTLVQTDANLDYSLLALTNNVSNTYGYLQLRLAGAVLGERIYIPQHPAAWGKRIAIASDNDTGGLARVQSLTEPRCGGTGNDVGYFADTQGGSSGSPVLSYDDHLVVALHHCANCPNRGVPIEEVINDLGTNLPNDALEGNCDANKVINTNPIPSDTYLVSNSITSGGIVPAGNNVVFDAGNIVHLTPGFHAKTGSAFHAFIDGCIANKTSNLVTESFLETSLAASFNNYPNPFENSTTISFTLEQSSNVSLSVFDVNGKEIIKLIDNEKRENGNHEILFDGSSLNSGIYFYTLQTDEKSITKKMVLHK